MSAIVLDTETTGLSPNTSRITEICIVDWDSGAVLLRTYLDPECPIPEEITKITGITDETVLGAPKFHEIAGDIASMISSADVVIGQNPFFDKGMLMAEFARTDKAVAWPLLVCTKRLWDVYEPREERHLMNAYKRFVDRKGFEGAHGALADTMACRNVLMAQIAEFGLQNIPWDEMDPERKLWWGPSAHVLKKDERLICNFGKNKDKPIAEVDVGFWRWIKERDFPDHVMMVAIKMIDFTESDRANLSERIHTWAAGYAREKF